MHVDGREEHVERDLACLELGEGFCHRVEGRDLDLALVLLGEVVHDLLVDVGHPVVELECRSCLGLKAGRDSGVIGEDRPFDRVVRTRERYATATRARARGRGATGAACAEQPSQSSDRERATCACEELTPRDRSPHTGLDPALSWVHDHGAPSPRANGPSTCRAATCPAAASWILAA